MRVKIMSHDPEHVEDVQLLEDWNLPVAFSALRLEPKLEVLRPNPISWRMKERVRTP